MPLSLDFIEIENVVTVEDLKTGLGNHYNFDDHDNFDEWKLFQAGLELDQPNVLLADLLPGGQVKIIYFSCRFSCAATLHVILFFIFSVSQSSYSLFQKFLHLRLQMFQCKDDL